MPTRPRLPNPVKFSRPQFGLLILVIGLVAPLLIAACGGGDPTAVPTSSPTATSLPPLTATNTPQPSVVTSTPEATEEPVANPVEVSSQGPLGQHLVDAEGMTLYLFANDQRNVSNCSAGCAATWPPLLVDGDPMAGQGVDAERLTTIQRADGTSHVTYNGKPLYYFASDEAAGDMLGQDRGGVWFVVSPDGGPVRTAATVNATDNGSFGNILTDASGNVLYLFTRDERGVSNCTGGCALAWPPLLTVEDPVPGEGVNEERIGVFSRGNGAKQVTYNGWPLYFFAGDEKPGDAMGQNRDGIWFVVNASGGAVYTKAQVNAAENGDLGSVLTDAAGRSLYLFTKDERNFSNCTGDCALAWPPLITMDEPLPGEGLSEDRIGTTTRQDGSNQVTYNGWPLYYFAGDERPGDAMGQDRGGVWFVITPNGSAVYTKAQVNAAEDSDLGSILTDAAGRSLYLFTNDERNVSNCAGGCALAWPPLITVDDPLPGEGLSEDRIGTTTRQDGSKQVTYNGWPLYYFAGDEKPGDAMGQDRGGFWFVITSNGSAVYTSAPVNAADNAEHGTILVDAAGRTLYLFTNDEPNSSNCAGGCALAWPPLITIDDPTPGDEVGGSRIGTTTRDDGFKQVTFDGNPLYYYAADEKPGDALGQNRGEVWFVINNSLPLEIALGEQNASGQTGAAILTGRGSFTNVSLMLSAGTLETELVHIHDGQCGPENLGGVAHALTSFEGGSGESVTNIEVSLDTLKTRSFAVNTHKTGEASVYTSCGDFGQAASAPGTLTSNRDDTLYETTGNQRNNGAGSWFFAGKTNSGAIRRGLISFDVADRIPAGVTVTSVSLTLNMSRSLASEIEVGLHRVLADWQEGAADAFGNEGSGADADQGDVTWTQRVFKSLDWDNPGGDFSPDASALAQIGGTGFYTWGSTSQLVADVQSWLDNPSGNFGWLLLGDETKSQTAKRFDSKENEQESNRPVLVVEFTE